MDGRVMEALRLLREAVRLDLLADGGDRSARVAWQAANGVAVAACSPPRGKRGRAPAQGGGWGWVRVWAVAARRPPDRKRVEVCGGRAPRGRGSPCR
ncbi:hypothetical protein NDU88_004982 [Pleurodeles waltl]|uniref:Uncharacterized protein n=1 Tax=Pleurodeles waltl TaxID=8319 RepID=A0AAV7RJS1_PLEWA|nr:hypothetical protein NDU88_004982 [Pleurodeles waltl]